MKPIKRAYFMVLGPKFVIFQDRKQFFINFDGINQFLFTFCCKNNENTTYAL
jgi:hypothetical protein